MIRKFKFTNDMKFSGIVVVVLKLFIMSFKWFKLASSLKVVAIHGKGNTGEKFSKRLSPFVDLTKDKADWIFPTAKYPVDDGFAWWTLPPGVRSFDAKCFEGVDESIKQIEDLYPFDVIIGHSQGAMLAAIILARGQLGHTEVRPQYAILSGAAWPAPFGPLLESVQSVHDLRSLHIIGDADNVNPPAMAERVATLMGGEVLRHTGGHVLPMDEASTRHYLSFLHL